MFEFKDDKSDLHYANAPEKLGYSSYISIMQLSSASHMSTQEQEPNIFTLNLKGKFHNWKLTDGMNDTEIDVWGFLYPLAKIIYEAYEAFHSKPSITSLKEENEYEIKHHLFSLINNDPEYIFTSFLHHLFAQLGIKIKSSDSWLYQIDNVSSGSEDITKMSTSELTQYFSDKWDRCTFQSQLLLTLDLDTLKKSSLYAKLTAKELSQHSSSMDGEEKTSASIKDFSLEQYKQFIIIFKVFTSTQRLISIKKINADGSVVASIENSSTDTIIKFLEQLLKINIQPYIIQKDSTELVLSPMLFVKTKATHEEIKANFSKIYREVVEETTEECHQDNCNQDIYDKMTDVTATRSLQNQPPKTFLVYRGNVKNSFCFISTYQSDKKETLYCITKYKRSSPTEPLICDASTTRTKYSNVSHIIEKYQRNGYRLISAAEMSIEVLIKSLSTCGILQTPNHSSTVSSTVLPSSTAIEKKLQQTI